MLKMLEIWKESLNVTVMLHANWYYLVSNQTLHRMANVNKISISINGRKWKCVGHTLRKLAADIAMIALDLNPIGTRRRGHQTTLDHLEAIASNGFDLYTFYSVYCGPILFPGVKGTHIFINQRLGIWSFFVRTSSFSEQNLHMSMIRRASTIRCFQNLPLISVAFSYFIVNVSKL